MVIQTKYAGANGNAVVYTAIKPSGISLTAKTLAAGISSVTDGLGSVSSNPSNLIDRLHSSGYSFTYSIVNQAVAPWPGDVVTVTYQITIPQDVVEQDFSEIYLLPDFILTQGGASGQEVRVYMTISAVDIFGRNPVALVSEFIAARSQVGPTTAQPNNFLHDNYFSASPGVTGHFGQPYAVGALYAHTTAFSCKSLISNATKLGIYDKFNVTFRVWNDGGLGAAAGSSVDFREIGILSPYEFDQSKEDFYVKVKGEIFGSTWGGRRTAANPVLSIPDAIEHLIRNYDEKPEAIDTDSFDDLADPSAGSRKDWFLGRQVESGNTFDLVSDLARFGFLGIIPKSDGTRAAKVWRNVAPVATHDVSAILEGSLGSREPTSLANLYNAPQVNYAWNPGSQKCDLFVQITKIDEDEFPAEATLDANGVALWKSYALGYNDDEYNRAKDNWDLCHLSWTRYGVIQPLPDEMANALWFPDAEGAWSLPASQNAAKLYMDEICRWTPFRKDVVPYRLPNTATHAARELLDRVTLNDQLVTAGEDEVGTIVRRAIIPGNGQDKADCIEISLMLDPDLG